MTKYLVLSDADIALSQGLERKQSQYRTQRDSLSIIRIDSTGIVTQNSIFLSNSIINNSKSIAISADKTTAYILQSRGEFPDSMRYSRELDWKVPIGKTLVAIDISDITEMKIIDTINVGKSPTSVVLSPDGKSLALTVNEKHSEIIRIILEDNQFKYVFRHPHAVYSKKGNIRATDISWHPSGKYFAVILEEDNTVAFYKFIETTYGTRLALLGAPVEIGESLTMTQFTPDGNYCVVLNQDSTKNKNALVSIKFDENGNHKLIRSEITATNPKYFDISPNGKQIVVLNKVVSEVSNDLSKHLTEYFSINLFELTENGTFSKRNETRISETSVQNINFDRSGQRIILSYSNYAGTKAGAIEFYEIDDTNNKLHKMNVKRRTPEGTHSVMEF